MKIQSMLLRTFAAASLLVPVASGAAGPQIDVYKTRTCGCCAKWVDHLKANGFTPVVTEVPSTAEYRKKYGVPDQLLSCHTAVVSGYTVEGHVPAADIHRMIKTKPNAKGLAVPGMPLGSPGMEAGRRDAYSVLLFKADGTTSVFQKYPGD
jgi:hypothetical protein